MTSKVTSIMFWILIVNTKLLTYKIKSHIDLELNDPTTPNATVVTGVRGLARELRAPQ